MSKRGMCFIPYTFLSAAGLCLGLYSSQFFTKDWLTRNSAKNWWEGGPINRGKVMGYTELWNKRGLYWYPFHSKTAIEAHICAKISSVFSLGYFIAIGHIKGPSRRRLFSYCHQHSLMDQEFSSSQSIRLKQLFIGYREFLVQKWSRRI